VFDIRPCTTHICIYVLLASKLHNVKSDSKGYTGNGILSHTYCTSVKIISTTNRKRRSGGMGRLLVVNCRIIILLVIKEVINTFEKVDSNYNCSITIVIIVKLINYYEEYFKLPSG